MRSTAPLGTARGVVHCPVRLAQRRRLGGDRPAAAQRRQRPATELLGRQREAPAELGRRRQDHPRRSRRAQVNSSQVQLRVAGPCTDGAMQSISQSGDVTCTPVLANEYGSNTAAVTLWGERDAGGVRSRSRRDRRTWCSAYPHAVISGAAGQHAEVDCTLSVPAGSGTPPPANPTTTTNSLAVDLGSGTQAQAGTIPLVLPVASSSSSAAGNGQLLRPVADLSGAGGHGRHDDQRDPDREQQLTTAPPVGCGPCQLLR